jgi:hypothetical protein
MKPSSGAILNLNGCLELGTRIVTGLHDRLGRSLIDLLAFLGELLVLGRHFHQARQKPQCRPSGREVGFDAGRVDLIPSHLDRRELRPLIRDDLAQGILHLPQEQIMPGQSTLPLHALQGLAGERPT